MTNENHGPLLNQSVHTLQFPPCVWVQGLPIRHEAVGSRVLARLSSRTGVRGGGEMLPQRTWPQVGYLTTAVQYFNMSYMWNDYVGIYTANTMGTPNIQLKMTVISLNGR